MSEGSVIVPLLNGVRHIDILKAKFGPERVLGGLTVINAALMPDGSIQQSQVRINLTAIGELDGRLSSRCTATKTALEAGGIPVQLTENILVMMGKVLRVHLQRNNSLVKPITRRSDRTGYQRSVLRLRRHRRMYKGRDCVGASAASRY
jgi:ketopantoate reductase